jgi:predicted HAD superfamily Cof-like phosphohydrolase
MPSNYLKVKEFMQVFGQEVPIGAEFPDPATVELRVDLIAEELQELTHAIAMKDIVGVADALTDILYVTYGAGIAFGIDLDECFDEVHESNMSKLDEEGRPIYREDGKVMKGPFYRPPNLKLVLQEMSM